MRLVSQLDCRSSETSSILVRGAKWVAGHGGQPASNPGGQRSIRWRPAPWARASLCARALQACGSGLNSPRVHQCSRPMARSAAWYAARADSISDGSSSLAVATSSPSAQTLNEAPVREEGFSHAQGGRVSAAVKSNFAREVYPDARFASNEEDSDRPRARALRMACAQSRLVRHLVANENQAGSIPAVRSGP